MRIRILSFSRIADPCNFRIQNTPQGVLLKLNDVSTILQQFPRWERSSTGIEVTGQAQV